MRILKAARNLPRTVWLGTAVGCLGAVASLFPAVLRLEQNVGLAGLFALRGSLEPPAEVAVVSFSGASAEALGVPTSDLDEWPRSLHAEVVDRLAEAGASVIVLDLIYKNASAPAEDESLVRALTRAGRVLLLDETRSLEVALGSGGATVPLDRRIRPIEPFRRAALATAPFVLPTVPFRTGQFWTFGRSAAGLPNLPAVALQAHLAEGYDAIATAFCEAGADCSGVPRSGDALLRDPDPAAAMARVREAFAADPSRAERIADAVGPDSRSRRLIDLYAGPAGRYLNYYGAAGTIPTVPMHVLIGDPGAAAALEGKVVFVGFSERRQAEQQDDFYTVFSQRTGRHLSGVEIGATAFANLLAGETLRLPGRLGQLAIVLVLGLVLGAVARPRRVVAAVVAGVLAGGGYLAAAYAAFVADEVWLPLVVPLGVQWPVWLVALLALEYRDLLGQRTRVVAALGHYVPERAVRRLARESFRTGPESELLEGVCLYTDAEQFTRVSEGMSPERLARLMNDYYDVLCTAAERHAGLVADLSGDSMVAIWAAARPDATLARSACAAAVAILDDVERFNAAAGAAGLPTRIGLDAGRLLLGDIGSTQRREYRAVGEIVTTAARLQSLNRQLGTRVLVSAPVAASADGFATRRLGRFLLLGKTTAVEVHELLGPVPDAAEAVARFAGFEQALERFARRDFAGARALFGRVAAAVPGDGPTRLYLEHSARYEAEPPPPDWRGTIRLDVK